MPLAVPALLTLLVLATFGVFWLVTEPRVAPVYADPSENFYLQGDVR